MGRVLAALIAAGMFAGAAGGALAQQAGAAPVPLSFELAGPADGGAIVIAGTAEPGARVEILEREKSIAAAVANRRGEWAVSLANDLAPGSYRLAVRSVSADGRHVLIADRRIELVVSGPPAAADVPEPLRLPDRVIVAPGDNLWEIARRLYGSGTEYHRLYQANRDLIARPRAIFPGQVLVVPAPAGGTSP